MTPLSEAEASAIWAVLEAHAGVDDFGRSDFILTQTAGVIEEYRFVGSLGFGGKFRRTRRDDRWYVDCYREDLTPARQAAIDATNAALAELQKERAA